MVGKATHYVDRCSVDGCPEPNSEEWHRPWCQEIKGHKCFGGATHQHIPKKGMGGHNPESEIVACLCAGAHDKIDNGPWGNAVLDVPGVGRVYRVWDIHDKTLLERITEAAPEGQASSPQESIDSAEVPDAQLQDWDCSACGEVNLYGDRACRFCGTEPKDAQALAVKEDLALESVPDEQLAALFAEADKHQAAGFLLKCEIVHTFRERHVQAWGSSWIEEAYTLFHVSRRTLNAYANLHEILDTSDRYLIEQIAPLTDSRGLMTHIGRKKPEDGRVALEAAVSYLADFAEAPTVKALMHKLGEEAKPPELCPESEDGRHHFAICKNCGKER